MTDRYTEIEEIVSAFFEKWQRQMKVAMVIASVLTDFKERGISITGEEIAEHLYRLIDKGDFETFGDIEQWRNSEIVPVKYRKT